jgi:hypothetical protein
MKIKILQLLMFTLSYLKEVKIPNKIADSWNDLSGRLAIGEQPNGFLKGCRKHQNLREGSIDPTDESPRRPALPAILNIFSMITTVGKKPRQGVS